MADAFKSSSIAGDGVVKERSRFKGREENETSGATIGEGGAALDKKTGHRWEGN